MTPAISAAGLTRRYRGQLALDRSVSRSSPVPSPGCSADLHFFRVDYIFAGPWYLTWLTSFIGLILLFVYGMWFGLVYRRWNLIGLLVFATAQAAVAVAGSLAATETHAWPAIGRFFTTLSAAGLTGVLAALAVALLAGGYATMRRVTV